MTKKEVIENIIWGSKTSWRIEAKLVYEFSPTWEQLMYENF